MTGCSREFHVSQRQRELWLQTGRIFMEPP